MELPREKHLEVEIKTNYKPNKQTLKKGNNELCMKSKDLC